MPTQKSIEQAVREFELAISHFKTELSKLQIGRASAYLVEQPLKAIANISVLDGQTLQVQPWDKKNLANIEKALRKAEINLNPINDGNILRIMIPPLTEERRKDLSKSINKMAEEAKISIRNIRQSAHTGFKELEKNKEASEDEKRIAEKKLQEKVDLYNKQIEELSEKKIEEVMKV